MMPSEEERMLAGILYSPKDEELVAKKLKSHNLSQLFNTLREDQSKERLSILQEITEEFGEGSFMQGPVFFHYGVHTKIGKNCFFNYNTVIQDDTFVTIGNNNRFGPNLTIVTPLHPMIATERREMKCIDGKLRGLCYARAVTIGNDCWFGTNVVVCPGVTIGDNVVIGAGSVVRSDIPSDCLAAGVPCRVIRKITQEETMANKPEILGGCSVI